MEEKFAKTEQVSEESTFDSGYEGHFRRQEAGLAYLINAGDPPPFRPPRSFPLRDPFPSQRLQE